MVAVSWVELPNPVVRATGVVPDPGGVNVTTDPTPLPLFPGLMKLVPLTVIVTGFGLLASVAAGPTAETVGAAIGKLNPVEVTPLVASVTVMVAFPALVSKTDGTATEIWLLVDPLDTAKGVVDPPIVQLTIGVAAKLPPIITRFDMFAWP